jgi:hypothetical protein
MFCSHHKSRFRRLKATEGNYISDELALTKTIGCALCLGAIFLNEALRKLLSNHRTTSEVDFLPSYLPYLIVSFPSLLLLLTNSISYIQFLALSVIQEMSCNFFKGVNGKWTDISF